MTPEPVHFLVCPPPSTKTLGNGQRRNTDDHIVFTIPQTFIDAWRSGSPSALIPSASHASAVVADAGGINGADGSTGGPGVPGSSTRPPSSARARSAPPAPTTEGGHRAPCGALSDAAS